MLIASHTRSVFNASRIVFPSSLNCIQCSAFKNNWEIKDVFFNGSKEEWDKVAIGYENDDILSANIYFNDDMEERATTLYVSMLLIRIYEEYANTVPRCKFRLVKVHS